MFCLGAYENSILKPVFYRPISHELKFRVCVCDGVAAVAACPLVSSLKSCGFASDHCRERTRFSVSMLLKHKDRPENLAENPYGTSAHGPAQSQACNCLRWRNRRGEGFNRGSGKCPQPSDSPKTRLRLGKCVEIQSEIWWEAAYDGVCPGTAVLLLDEWQDIRRNNAKIAETCFWSLFSERVVFGTRFWTNAKKRTRR